MNLVLAKTDTGPAVGNVFVRTHGRLPGAGPVADIRARAFEAYKRAGLPHRRIEEWKYTDLRVLMRDVLPRAPQPDTAALARAKAAVEKAAIEGAAKLVLVDGLFTPNLSDIVQLGQGVDVRTLREVLENPANEGRGDLLLTATTDAVISLNAAMVTDGVVITVTDGTVLSRPIQIVHVATTSSASSFTRSYLRLGKGVQAAVVESFVAAEGARAYQANDAVIVSVGDAANLAHLHVVADEADATNISSVFVALGAKAKLNLFNMICGGAVSRYQGFITLVGEGSALSVNGVNLLKDKQHGDTTLVIDHAVPHCTSRENFRAVVDDRGHSVFQGHIIVRPDAQKTDGRMMTRALLLSDEAEADNKPELEIFADDVTCGHGATTGALDESLLFYLRARGLPEKEAQALLIQAFVGEAIESITNDQLREHVIAAAERWLEARG
ncbi:Fe-S cluster assembly protein SufD [Bradyrhizobium cenepequi]|uniref:Fe-S cluster assembly protein SufD n=1 Tax=Bradyrhizobium cenepequi TaxID=2821403 RepID=UPI001CE382E0|nr:Fe-S cluster assembly protein SufD [Bradyrhizobium cenepequi]MCA6113187.1 Fe-S cluster assembly protein SufD [Bradyrhizobium cenepequi]